MATRPRTSKRVCAIRRAPDGSAFEKCERCGISVAILLADLHECEPKKETKRFRGIAGKKLVSNQNFEDQPLSPFRLFMYIHRLIRLCCLVRFIDDPIFAHSKGMTLEKQSGFFSMESFMRCCNTESLIEIDRRGFETWKNMSKEEKQPYVSQAGKVNSAYEEALKKEVDDMIQVNDEADSAMVVKFDQLEFFEYSDYASSEGYDWFNTGSESWTAHGSQ